MENKILTVDHCSPGSNINQHYQQHFQQHYAATGETLDPRYPNIPARYVSSTSACSGSNGATAYEAHHQELSKQHQTPLSSFESHSQLFQSNTLDQTGGGAQVQQKNEQSKKTVQTTTTTTTTQPVIVTQETLSPTPIMNAIEYTPQVVEQIQIHHVPCTMTQQSTISVEHYPSSCALNWSSCDTYLHIFLTFYFGHFAAMLFFDGILRSIANLYILEHTATSPLVFIVHIIFSIAYLAFTIWFMTICWRWWRNKSLQPDNGLPNLNQGPRDRQVKARGYVFFAACVLIVGFFVFLTIGIIELDHKRSQERFNIPYGRYNTSAYIGDWVVFVFRLVFWVVGIVATLLLSRDVLTKYCCPAKHIKINKERPTTVYQVHH